MTLSLANTNMTPIVKDSFAGALRATAILVALAAPGCRSTPFVIDNSTCRDEEPALTRCHEGEQVRCRNVPCGVGTRQLCDCVAPAAH